jgi:undecaprenyl diphosphate synthase
VNKEELAHKEIPNHVAIIMDGNGRWAKMKGQDRVFGHMNGVSSIRNVLKAAIEIGVNYLTLYAFSTENWDRPKNEVDALMNLLVKSLLEEVEELNKNGVRLNAIGDLEQLPIKAQDLLKKSIDLTRDNSNITLTLALSYSARWEILNAAKKIAEKVKDGSLNSKEINEQLFSSELTTSSIPDPELLIRTSGEHRISNFLLWQLAYAEFYFTDELWPDFDKQSFYKAIANYQLRERRFGKISEQVENE